MATYKFARRAEQDLEHIIDYTLEQWDFAQTDKYIDGLEERAQMLADHPESGTKREGIAQGLFSFPYQSHVLYYFKQRHGITVVRVLHKLMDPVRHV